MSLTIRIITSGDNSAIEQIIRSVLEEHGVNKPGTAYFDESLKTMFEFYTGDHCVYYVAEWNGKLVGGSGIYPTKGLPADTCELVKMYLSNEVRGKGIGQALLEKCLSFAKEKGYQRVYLETLPELNKAVGMYAKNGFTTLSGPLGDSGHFACDLRMIKVF